jgi:flagellar motor switch protein FliG
MATVADLSAPSAPLEVSKMTKLQKLAALLIILGPESASAILRTLDPQALEAVSVEMARLPMITQEMRQAILAEISEVALAASTAVPGGMSFAQTVLEKALGNPQASELLDRVAHAHGPPPAMQRIVRMEPRQLVNLLRDEHPQTIALVASYLSPNRASELLSLLRPELRDQVIERLATLAPVPVEVVETVAEVLNRQVQGKTLRGLTQTGGVKTAADVLNALAAQDKNLGKAILAALEERNAELGQAIRQKMFTFADLIQLDVASLQKIMREIDMRDLALALKKADPALKTKLLSAISKRAAETVTEEMSFLGSVKLKEIEAAQMRIVEVVRRLENDGEIELEASPGNSLVT